MPHEFSATDEPIDSRTHCVVVRGEVDIFTAPEFKAHVTRAIDSGADVVLVDLTETSFMDSSSLGVLISAHRRLGMRDGRLVVATAVPAVLNTLRITGLDGVFDVVESREAALAGT